MCLFNYVEEPMKKERLCEELLGILLINSLHIALRILLSKKPLGPLHSKERTTPASYMSKLKVLRPQVKDQNPVNRAWLGMETEDILTHGRIPILVSTCLVQSPLYGEGAEFSIHLAKVDFDETRKYSG